METKDFIQRGRKIIYEEISAVKDSCVWVNNLMTHFVFH